MAATATEVIGTIGAIQTLIENFPMSIFELFGNKTYDNVLDFIIDVLKQLGISDRVLVDKLIELFFGVANAIEMYGEKQIYSYRTITKPTDEQKEQAIELTEVPSGVTSLSPNYILVDGVYYVKKSKISEIPDELQSGFLVGLENTVKAVLATILSSILSCSINPEVSTFFLDYNSKDSLPTVSFTLPKSAFDNFNLLDIYPLSYMGCNYYSGVDDETMDVNTLYRANDLNTFLWYVINRGSTITQVETNKMMWDSRLVAAREGNENEARTDSEKWNEWLNSKSDETGLLVASGETDLYNQKYLDDNDTVELPLHPILQIKPTEIYGYGNGIEISFPQQTWVKRNSLFNKTMYRFNIDYLNNIQIFNPRLIIVEMINTLLNGALTLPFTINYSFETKLLETRLKKVIAKAMEVEDLSVEDCFFTFSNTDFNDALKEMELQKYGAKQLNSETSPAIKIDPNMGIDAMNEINSMATMNEKLTSLSRTVYDISTIPTRDPAIEISDRFSLNYNEKWLNDVIMALVMPLAKALFTPKVMLLYVINCQIMGLINVDDISSIDDIIDLFIKKILSIILSLIKYVRDKIVEFLYDLFLKTIKPLLVEWGVIILNEKLAEWIALLEEAISCIPLFNFGKTLTSIDDVNYADITKTQDIPQSEESC